MYRISIPKLPKSKRPRTRKDIIKNISVIFKKYIRHRDLDHAGWTRCCTCSKPIQIKGGDINAGHFMIDKRLATRWNERNCHAQCVKCNMEGGQQYEHAKYIDKRWGEGTAAGLERDSLTSIKYFIHDLLYIENQWKQKLAELKGVK